MLNPYSLMNKKLSSVGWRYECIGERVQSSFHGDMKDIGLRRGRIQSGMKIRWFGNLIWSDCRTPGCQVSRMSASL